MTQSIRFYVCRTSRHISNNNDYNLRPRQNGVNWISQIWPDTRHALFQLLVLLLNQFHDFVPNINQHSIVEKVRYFSNQVNQFCFVEKDCRFFHKCDLSSFRNRIVNLRVRKIALNRIQFFRVRSRPNAHTNSVRIFKSNQRWKNVMLAQRFGGKDDSISPYKRVDLLLPFVSGTSVTLRCCI